MVVVSHFFFFIEIILGKARLRRIAAFPIYGYLFQDSSFRFFKDYLRKHLCFSETIKSKLFVKRRKDKLKKCFKSQNMMEVCKS